MGTAGSCLGYQFGASAGDTLIPLSCLACVLRIRDTKGTFHAKMGTVKDRNDMDLKEAEDIKKRWQEYTELYKKDLNDPNNCDGVITHLEPDILECEVKWALGDITMNKASEGGRIPKNSKER